MSLKPWREITFPHRDVLEGTFQDLQIQRGEFIYYTTVWQHLLAACRKAALTEKTTGNALFFTIHDV